MTCLEKYLKEHPDIKDIEYVFDHECPHGEGTNYVSDEDCEPYCNEGHRSDCAACWNQEVKEEEPIDNNKIVEELEPLPSNPDFAPYVYEPKTTSKLTDSSVQKAFYAAGKAAEHAGETLKKVLTIDIFPSEAPAIGTIKDSGDRTEFASGAVRDMREGKGRCDLMPLDVVGLYIEEDNQTTDWVLHSISQFQEYGGWSFLYSALNTFAHKHEWDSYTMFLEVAKHFEEGAKKYGENNWQKGIPVKCYIDSAVRHYLKFLRGDKDEPHDRAFVWNILCCIWTCKHHPELNDYLMKEGTEG
jgi:hypothetical protein